MSTRPGMDAAAWLRAKEILGDLAGLAPDERASHVAAACAGDTALQAEVERLVTLDDQARAYFTQLKGASRPETRQRPGRDR